MPDLREFQAQFESPDHTTDGASTAERPDAIAPDYLVALSFGPIQRSDPSAGLLDRAWRLRVDNATGEVHIARSDDAGAEWVDEVLLFSVEV